MSRFSKKHGYDKKISKEIILEDAPDYLRIVYFNSILIELTYVDRDHRYKNSDNKPLGYKELYEEFYNIQKKEPDEDYTDSWRCANILKNDLNNCEWYYFYDFLELVGKKLKEFEEDPFITGELVKVFGFTNYQTKLNDLFTETNIGWRLTKDSELEREIPKVISDSIENTQKLLEKPFDSAREHYKKALRYLYQYPIDPQNSIKEMISAIESIGKTFYSNTSTLGDVIKELKKNNVIPLTLINIIEKFYLFTNKEPAIRHGSSKLSKISTNEAEFCLNITIGIIRYLITVLK